MTVSGGATGRRAKAQYFCMKCEEPTFGGGKSCEICGKIALRFDSKAEYRRFHELRLMEKAGEIYGLRPHPRYELIVRPNVSPDGSGLKVGVYTADFEYVVPDWHGAVTVVEDVKPFRALKSKRNLGKKVPIMTADAALRIRLFEILYDRKVRVVA